MSTTPESIFLTGATGYVGSALLPIFREAFPQTPITVLVRQATQGELITAAYPNTTFVQGTHDSTSLLKTTAATSHIVVHASDFDHAGATQALLPGTIARQRAGTQPQGIYIGISGAASTVEINGELGELSPKTYSDTTNWDEILDFPSSRPHVEIERQVTRDSEAAGVRAVVLAPPEILHSGLGIGKKDSHAHYHINRALDAGKGQVLGKGKNRTSWIHVEDLGEAVVWFIHEAMKEEMRVEFGMRGYYLAEAGEMSMLERVGVWADELVRLGAIGSRDVEEGRAGEVEWDEKQRFVLGGNMRVRGERLRELGWRPRMTEWEGSFRGAARQEVEKWKGLKNVR
ncbi:hypothetical protein M409DRAFT_26033 [Zasmidium cellare ATCC 36951]|uniref:NAD-dependent epimerase/dehydratase domain-containing protein n=1 Tax=Zasmidium cellare ATCC 36951 TaxID=1080233 RepID=A0A6A6C8A0_ZASCE|nr:uncharacterized protein M409DRAFT_26033 [Zasmidium cellare ATCC 36951]KAF2163417.1 hypothetical protein M409DRAFT_26033 [Zasmidium cellare ATCC 36951]